jgi:LysR family transcriptional activator of glutamate synthase operon
MRRVQTDELRWLVAVVASGNVTRTARRLHVSQSALSRAIGRLEAQVGVALFDRVGRTLVPTRYGRIFAAHASRALAELDAGRTQVLELAGAGSGEIRLAFLHTLGIRLVPQLIRGFREAHPAVRFTLSQDAAGAMHAALRDGAADLILTSPRPDDAQIGWAPLLRQPLRLVVPPEHPLAGRRRVRLAELADDPWIALPPAAGLRGMFDELVERAGFTPRIAFEGEDIATVRGLVAAGLGVALLPETGEESRAAGAGGGAGAAAAPEQLPALAVADAGASRTVGLAWHRERYRSPAVQAFADFVVAAHASPSGHG